MTDRINVPGATNTATEIAGQATDDLVPADLSRADDKADAGTDSALSSDDIEIPGATYEIASAASPDAGDSASAERS